MDTTKKSGKVYQNALRYIYLITGRVSELSGSYAAAGNDAHKIKIENSEAVMFLVKTARQPGKRRGVVLPLNDEYEPWAETIYKWFEVHEDSKPFGSLSMRSFQREAGELFKGLMWPVDEYRKVVYTTLDKVHIVREKLKEEGGIEYLVEYTSGERHWVDDPKVAVETEVREPHWRPFTLQSLRQLRIWELKHIYGFSDTQIGMYTGMSGIYDDLRIPGVSHVNVYGQDVESQKLYADYVKDATSYYKLLLKPRE